MTTVLDQLHHVGGKRGQILSKIAETLTQKGGAVNV